MAKSEAELDKETEALIVGTNEHLVYHRCPSHGFGISTPFNAVCPDCGQECTLYVSGADVRQIINVAYEKVLKEIGLLVLEQEMIAQQFGRDDEGVSRATGALVEAAQAISLLRRS